MITLNCKSEINGHFTFSNKGTEKWFNVSAYVLARSVIGRLKVCASSILVAMIPLLLMCLVTETVWVSSVFRSSVCPVASYCEITSNLHTKIDAWQVMHNSVAVYKYSI